MAFALAIRNTLTEPRRLMLTSTSIVSISSVIVCGSSIQPILNYFFIPTNVDEAMDHNSTGFSVNQDPNTSFNRFRHRTGSGSDQILSPVDDVNIGPSTGFSSISGGSIGGFPGNQNTSFNNTSNISNNKNVYEKAWLVRKWYNFDTNFMKPFLTHARPCLMETMPNCCLPVTRFLTTTQQMMNAYGDGGSSNGGGDIGGNFNSEHSMIITAQPSTAAALSFTNNGRHQKVSKSSKERINIKTYQSIRFNQ